MSDLQARLLAAHQAGNIGKLAHLYAEAAQAADTEAAEGFFLTHAYIFALEAGNNVANTYRQRLVEMGREPPT